MTKLDAAILLAIFSTFLTVSDGLLRVSIAHCHRLQPFLPLVMTECTGKLAQYRIFTSINSDTLLRAADH